MRFGQALAQARCLLTLFVAQSLAIREQEGASIMRTLPLFGNQLPWNTSDVTWVSVDDRVRGGSSRSHFTTVKGTNFAACFSGELDTSTLGGAGFASCTTEWADQNRTLDLGDFDGLFLDVVSADEKKYTFIVKDEVPDRRSDGRMRSGVSWEFDFAIKQPSDASVPQSSDNLTRIFIPWTEFRATYRGRDVENPQPLRTDEIRRFSIMVRSFFDNQVGKFELVLQSVVAYKKRGEVVAEL